jgi:hypothetical protein
MLGGLLYELLTAGHPPYHWLLGNVELLLARLRSSVPVRVPGISVGASGLWGKGVVAAAREDGEPVPWWVRVGPHAASMLKEAQDLVSVCCAADPEARITMRGLADALESLGARLGGGSEGRGRVSPVHDSGGSVSGPVDDEGPGAEERPGPALGHFSGLPRVSTPASTEVRC